MSENFGFAAEIIRRSAAGYAGLAASMLTDRERELLEQAGAQELWKKHLIQRLLELSAALGAGESRLFSERVVWSRKTFAARDQDDHLLATSLKCLRDVLADALPARAAQPATRFLDAAITELDQPMPQPEASTLDPATATGRLALTYLQDVLEGNSAQASRSIVAAVEQGMPAADAYIEVLLGAQREIGRLWHANEVSVAEEHLVSATTQKTMAVIAHVAQRQPGNGATVVSACVAGNAHDIASRALADLFYLAGWRSIFLGADVPVSDLPAVLDAYDADLLTLTGTLSTQAGEAAAAIRGVREHCERPVKVMVGGALFDEAPDMAGSFGADAYSADLREALSIGAQLLKA